MIVVAIPSRGLMHSRTMEDILKNTAEYRDVRFVFAHGLPQPDAENHIIEEALKLEPDHIWILDDDIEIPRGVLYEMLNKKADLVVSNYPCSAHGNPVVHIREGRFESAGMGCVLVKPVVFEKLERPYFRTNVQYVWNGQELSAELVRPEQPAHGLHDVDWFQRLLKVGIEPIITETNCGQYRIINAPYRTHGNNTNLDLEIWRL